MFMVINRRYDRTFQATHIDTLKEPKLAQMDKVV